MATKPAVKKPNPTPIRRTAFGAKLATSAAPAAQTAQAASTQATAAAERPKRKKVALLPPIDRALKRAKTIDKNARLMLKLVANWQGEANEDQQTTNADIVTDLQSTAAAAKAILLNVDMLKASGFAPIAGRGGASKEPLAAGAQVKIVEKHFNSKLYGINDFEVVLDAGKQVRIRPTGDLRAPQVDVMRSWLKPLESDAIVDEGDEVNEDEANQ